MFKLQGGIALTSDVHKLVALLVGAAEALDSTQGIHSEPEFLPSSDSSDKESRVLPVAFVLDNLMRPRNVASILKTSEALGCAGGVWVTGTTPKPLSQPTATETSSSVQGGLEQVVYVETAAEAVATLQRAGVTVWACL